jgi:PIN domain nuclease of toxin-antitoxin system
MVGISIKEVQKDAIEKLNFEGHEIAVSEISFFELSAKAAKFVTNNVLLPEWVTSGIRALLFNEDIEKITIYSDKVFLDAFTLKGLMVDFIDCLILSTAINYCEALITEDNVIRNLPKNKNFLELISKTNQNFRILNYIEAITNA